jgi:hypothetical protein
VHGRDSSLAQRLLLRSNIYITEIHGDMDSSLVQQINTKNILPQDTVAKGQLLLRNKYKNGSLTMGVQCRG